MININTGLSGFLLIDRITHAEAQSIRGGKTFVNAPSYLGLESLAQLGAFHVRYLIGFERHAFLLKVISCVMPAKAELNGTYMLSGKLVNKSRSAFSYILEARKGDRVQIEGELIFAAVDYNQDFKKETLKDHYRNVFSCLRNDTKTE